MRLARLSTSAALILGVLCPFSVLGQATNPHINSVTQVWARPYQTIEISGYGFGTNWQHGNSPFLQFLDVTQNWSAGHTGDAVELTLTWTDHLITITYFGGAYGTGNLVLNGGDVVQVRVWNPQSGQGPAKAQVSVLANLDPAYYFSSGGNSGTPLMDDQGNFYGVGGGTNLCNTYYACGDIYQLSPISGAYNQTVLYDFVGDSQGWEPQTPLVRDLAGNIYGTTVNGGDTSLCFQGRNCGVVFEISNSQETVLHTFTGQPDGLWPTTGLVADSAGNLYGTTAYGGAYNYGTLYELSPDGSGGFTYSVIHSFQGSTALDGAGPTGSLTIDGQGNLFGTTGGGGLYNLYCGYTFGCGTVFELVHSGAGFTEKILYAFRGTANGVYPSTGVTLDSFGNLYGTTQYGGPSCGNRNSAGCGVVYMLTPQKTGKWTQTILYTFATNANDVDGSKYPTSALTYYNGLFYGFAGNGASQLGTLYSIVPATPDSMQTIYSYGGNYANNSMDGGTPTGQPFIGTDGILYGASGGAIDILPLTPPAHLTKPLQHNQK